MPRQAPCTLATAAAPKVECSPAALQPCSPADMLLKGMAYNLTLAMQQRLAPKDRAVVHTAATIRRWWFVLPAVVGSHARNYFLRLPREVEHGHYGQACSALAALTAGT